MSLNKYYRWYEKQYAEVIKLPEYRRRVDKADVKWLQGSLKQFEYRYSSIWRSEVLDNLKYHITPRKTEQITTVFKIDRVRSLGKDRSVEFHTTYAFLYSHNERGKTIHDYVCIAPTLQSADGEYRQSFISFKQFSYYVEHFNEVIEKVESQIAKQLKEKAIGIQIESFFPLIDRKKKNFDRIKKKFLNLVDEQRLALKLYSVVWVMQYYRYNEDIMENHITPGYKESIITSEEDTFYNEQIRPMFGPTDHFSDRFDRVIVHPKQHYAPADCGQKLIPLKVKDMENPENIRLAPWREVYIASRVGDLVINGICAGFPIYVDWFLISTNSPSIWDNQVSHTKLDHSMIATDIVRKLENARKYTYDLGSKGDELFISYKMQGLSETIEVPMEYAEKELILAPVTLCSVTEHVGRTIADLPNMMKKSFYRLETGPLYSDVRVFGKYLFEYVYTLYSMNYHLHAIHTDLHLNNIALNTIRQFHHNVLSEDPELMVTNVHVIYDLSDGDPDSDLESFIFPHYGRYATIIDFSRGVIGRDQLLKDFPEHQVDQIISNQRRRLQNAFARELPEFYKGHALQIEALFLQNFDLGHRYLTAIDTYKLTRGFISMFTRDIPDLVPEVEALVKKVNAMALNFLTIEIQRAFRREVKTPEQLGYPNLKILRECFKEFRIELFNQKAGRRNDPNKGITIVDVFQAHNPLRYNIREYEKFPPQVKFDYLIRNKITVNDAGLKNYEQYREYVAKEHPMQKLETMAEELKQERDERRGRPKPDKLKTESK